MFIRKTVDHWV